MALSQFSPVHTDHVLGSAIRFLFLILSNKLLAVHCVEILSISIGAPLNIVFDSNESDEISLGGSDSAIFCLVPRPLVSPFQFYHQ